MGVRNRDFTYVNCYLSRKAMSRRAIILRSSRCDGAPATDPGPKSVFLEISASSSTAWRGEAPAWQSETWQSETWQSETWRDETWRDEIWRLQPPCVVPSREHPAPSARVPRDRHRDGPASASTRSGCACRLWSHS